MTWSATQYSAFEQERTRPVRDLVAALPARGTVRTAIDLGCGPGNSTEVLAQRFPGATVSGLDSSEDMVAAARQRLPGLRFDLADIAAWTPAEPFDVILANASLQWVPDHAELYPRLVSLLNPGGSLAVQTPDNLEEPAHRLAREIAGRQLVHHDQPDLSDAAEGAVWRTVGEGGKLFGRKASAAPVCTLVAGAAALWSYDQAAPRDGVARSRVRTGDEQ